MTPTPTCNSVLAFRPGHFTSLVEALDYAAQGETGINIYDGHGRIDDTVSYGGLRQHARAAAAKLLSNGLRTGQHVALIAETSISFLTLFYACQYAGLVPCPLPVRPIAGSPEKYARQLHRLIQHARASMVLAPRHFLRDTELATRNLSVRALDFDHLLDGPSAPWPATPVVQQPIAYIQFTSGSTAEPKGIVITQSALMANATAIAAHGLRMRPEDRAFSWLPLYHDMGLVGFSVVALCGQRSVDYLSPMGFAARPLLWLRLMSACRSTIVYAPAFAWQLAARRYDGQADIDLSSLRIAGLGGDMIQGDILRECQRRLAPTGLRAEAMQPSYGMAEATLAICMTDADALPSIDHVKLAQQAGCTIKAIATGPGHATKDFVGAGRPLPGMELEVRDTERVPVDEGVIGHIWARGPSVMTQYLDDFARNSHDERGFLDTGDVGYLRSGELFVTGRAKDMLKVNGRNIWLRDLEWIAEGVAPLKVGDAAALATGDAGHEALLLLVEHRPPGEEKQRELREKLGRAVMQALGIHIDVLLVRPRSLPHTTSGKIARKELCDMYAAGEFD
ncbi:AMP-binding protein [Dyella sp. C9]|uniref:AMP-binding protein n=1 Tax=Dyella sp. C9 TaxID=2202154 RepID=UPI000DEEB8F7|nr:AMP-binding protein [Dyella sp. C9]